MSQNRPIQPSLLDILTAHMGRHCVSELKYLSDEQLAQLAQVVSQLSPDTAPLCQWNDALDYLAYAPAESNAAAAQQALIHLLSPLFLRGCSSRCTRTHHTIS